MSGREEINYFLTFLFKLRELGRKKTLPGIVQRSLKPMVSQSGHQDG